MFHIFLIVGVFMNTGTLLKNRAVDQSYSEVVFNVQHDLQPLTIKVCPTVGCSLSFSEEVQGVWVSNNRDYEVIQFGPRNIIIKARSENPETSNIFLNFNGFIVESLVVQSDLANADRLVRVRLLDTGSEVKAVSEGALRSGTHVSHQMGGGESQLQINPPIVNEADVWLLPVKSPRHDKDLKFADIIYDLDSLDQRYLYFSLKPGAAPVEQISIVRGIRKFLNKEFKIVYDVPAQMLENGEHMMLLLDAFAMGSKERLYLRVMQEGARNASFYKLRYKK